MGIYTGVYIPQIEAKYLYKVDNYTLQIESEKKKRPKLNTDKFTGTMDDSLDLRKLREIWKGKYKRTNFTDETNDTEYLKHVINVKFTYPLKEFEHVGNGLYVRNGYSESEVCLDDKSLVWIVDGELRAIQVYMEPKERRYENKEDFENRKEDIKKQCKVSTPTDANYLSVKYYTKTDKQRTKSYFHYDAETEVYYVKRRKNDKSNIPVITHVEEMRKHLYEHGFTIDKIKYVRWGRSAGASRNGSVLFINKQLHDAMHKWNLCGLDIKQGERYNLAALEAYKALTLSSIIDTVDIQPENILILSDWEQGVNELVNIHIVKKDKDNKLFANDVATVQHGIDGYESLKSYDELRDLLYQYGRESGQLTDEKIEILFDIFLQERGIDRYRHSVAEACDILGIDNEPQKWEVSTTHVQNSIWDGQSLLDVSMFPEEYKECGFLLLRNQWFKSACFSSNLQKWFADNEINSRWQLSGVTLAKDISQIKLITTLSSIKYYKFGSLEKWIENIDHTFGIVKHDKPTHFFGGRMVQTNYQLLNTLDLSCEDVGELLKPSLDYLQLLKNYPAVARFQIDGQKFEPDSDDDIEVDEVNSASDVVLKLLNVNEDFAKTRLYHNFILDMIGSYKDKLRCGKVLVPGTYATLFGNPMFMLQHLIRRVTSKTDPRAADLEEFEPGTLYCKFFDDGEELLCCRNPHTSGGNLYLAKNKSCPMIDKYFNLTKEIVCVDSRNHNLLQRLSGSDFDSDAVLITNHGLLVNKAKQNYDKFLVSVTGDSLKAKTKKLPYNAKNLVDLDVKTSENRIGEITNIAQVLNSLYWETHNIDILPDIALLAVLSGLEIDAAKKEPPVDNGAELKKIRAKYKIYRNFKYPNFMQYTGKYKNTNREYEYYNCPMDHIVELVKPKIAYTEVAPVQKHGKQYKFIDFIKIFHPKSELKEDQARSEQIGKIIDRVKTAQENINSLHGDESKTEQEKRLLIRKCKKECTEDISKNLSEKTVHQLLSLIENDEHSKIQRLLFYALFSSSEAFIKMINNSAEPVKKLVECKPNEAEFILYGIPFKSKVVKKTVK